MAKRKRIKWAADPAQECGHSWPARAGETVSYVKMANGKTYTNTVPALGEHRCVKDARHVDDPTDDDHQCCCGNSDWITP